MKNLHCGAICHFCAIAAAAVGLLFASPVAHGQTPIAAGSQPLVTVGGQTITNSDYQAALEMAAGKTVLTKLVLTALVRQAAAKADLMPTDKDIDARISDLQRTNPQQARVVSTPAGRDDLTTDIALEDLRLQGVTVSDAEVAAFYTDNKALFTIPSQVQTTLVVSQTLVDSQRAEVLLDEGVSPEAIARKPGLRVAGIDGFNVNMASLPPDVREKIGQDLLAMKPDQIKTVPVLDKYFLTFKVKSAEATSTPPLAQIKDEVTRQARLRKAISPQQELATLYRNNPPTFSDPRYKSYLGDVANASVSP